MSQRLPSFDGCFCCGQTNRSGLKVPFYVTDGEVFAHFIPSNEYYGYPGIMHGGLSATLLDEAMTWAATVAEGRFHYAAEIKVRYRAPVADKQEIIIKAKMTDKQKKILFVEGTILDSDNNVLVKSEGKYYPLPEKNDLTVKQMMTHHENGFKLT